MATRATAVPGVSAPIEHVSPDQYSDDKVLMAKIMRKRQDEMNRRSRLLDPRSRMSGVDPKGVQSQAVEKQIMASAAAEEAAEAAQAQLLHGEVLNQIEAMKKDAARQKQMDTVQYSLNNLNKESRREYDLSDPNYLRNATWPGADGEPIGPAAMQDFEGDVDIKAVQKEQRQMQREWLLQQMQEKEERREFERQCEGQYAQEVLKSTKLREAIESVEAQEAKHERMEQARENLQMASEIKERNAKKKVRDVELNARHVDMTMNSERINEVYDYKFDAMGRLARDEYKRLTQEQVQAVYDANAQQILEKTVARQMEAAADAENAEQALHSAALMEELERLQRGQAKERLVKMTEHNKGGASTKRQNDLEAKANYKSFS